MLHICRTYKPDEVHLHLSREMVERHKADNRYVYCIEKLGKLLEHSFDIKVIENSLLGEVQDYDIYYHEFKKYISERNIKAVQVMTPERSIQAHFGKDKDYDPE